MTEKIEYNWVDASILLSILYNNDSKDGSADLANIIQTFDFIQHCGLTYLELTGALVRLTANNYITDNGNLTFNPSEFVISQYKKQKEGKKRIYVDMDLKFIEKLIGAKEWNKDYDIIKVNQNLIYGDLTEEKFKATEKFI